MLSGDVITKIGPFKIIDFDDYMQAIRKSEPGREVTIIVQRGKNEFKFFVVM
jgi:S1-C subfamily serine protease